MPSAALARPSHGNTRQLATRPLRVRIGAVGNATAAALRAAGWEPDCIPTMQTAEALAAALGTVPGCRILFPASEIARPTLPDNLRARGANVTVVTVYRTVATPPEQTAAVTAQLRAGAIDAITFTSPSTVQGFLPLLANLPSGYDASGNRLHRARHSSRGSRIRIAGIDGRHPITLSGGSSLPFVSISMPPIALY